MSVGSYGVGHVGRFNRVLPPRTRTEYEVGYELGLEVLRWFHYRHGVDVGSPPAVRTVSQLEELLMSLYEHRVFSGRRKYWSVLQEQARAYVREFKDTFRDVLAEMEFIR